MEESATASPLWRSKITRRQVLVAAASSAALTVIWGDDQARAAPTGAFTPSLKSDNLMSVRFFSASFGVAHDWDLASSIKFTRPPASIDEVIAVFRTDSRVLTVRDTLVVQSDLSVKRVVASSRTKEGNTDVTLFTIRREDFGSSGVVRAALPYFAPHLFPNDGHDNVALPTVDLTFGSSLVRRQTLSRVLAVETTTAVTPWAVELSAAWDAVSVLNEGAALYRAPVLIRIRSIGPNPTPPGLSIVVGTSAFHTGSPAASPYLGNEGRILAQDLISLSSETSGDFRTTTLSVLEQIPIGEDRSVILVWPNEASSDAGPFSPMSAVVNISSMGDASHPRRLVGARECLTDQAIDPNITENDLARKAL